MRSTLWGTILAMLLQIGFLCWNVVAPLRAGPTYTQVILLQYAGVGAGAVLLIFLTRAIRHQAAGRRAVRGSAMAALALSALTALLVLAAMVAHLVQSPAETPLYGAGSAAAAFSWLALVVLGITTLSSRPRPIVPVALLLLVFLAGIGRNFPLAYDVAGPAGEPDTSYLIRVSGGEPHPGRIYGLTVWSGPATLADYLYSLVEPRIRLVPEADPSLVPDDAVLERMLVDSEEMAKAVGLQVLGRGKGAIRTENGATVTLVRTGTPAAAVLHVGDLIVAVNGAPVVTWADVVTRLGNVGPGVAVTFSVQRDGKPHTLTLTTAQNPSNPEKGLVGIQGGDQVAYDIPVPITTAIPPGVGGPSMGLALTLQVIDQLTPGGITNGWRVAATGTILPDGKVGAVGSVPYKLLGAERVGAGVLFVPRENFNGALLGGTQVQVVPVDSVQEALGWLQAHPR